MWFVCPLRLCEVALASWRRDNCHRGPPGEPVRWAGHQRRRGKWDASHQHRNSGSVQRRGHCTRRQAACRGSDITGKRKPGQVQLWIFREGNPFLNMGDFLLLLKPFKAALIKAFIMVMDHMTDYVWKSLLIRTNAQKCISQPDFKEHFSVV